MTERLDMEMETELRFFGKMTASISHEIKNVMAIVNESAGLLEDYTLMADKGLPVNPEKLHIIAQRVARQVRRADEIVKNMNSLAHSVDDFEKSVDIGETLKLAVGLSTRLADMRSVTLDLSISSDPVTAITSPFHLQNLIWQILDFAMETSGERKTVGLTFETGPESAKIRFTGLEALKNLSESAFPTKNEDALLRILGAIIHQNSATGEIELVLPRDMRSPGHI